MIVSFRRMKVRTTRSQSQLLLIECNLNPFEMFYFTTDNIGINRNIAVLYNTIQ